MNEARTYVADVHPGFALVIAAPAVTLDTQPGWIGFAQRDGLESEPVEAVDQPHIAGERYPLQAAHGQQIGDSDDAQPRTACVTGGQIADLDDIGSIHLALSRGADQRLDGLVQIAFQKQRFVIRQAYPGGRTELTSGVGHAKQLGHKRTDLGAMGLEKALRDERFEKRSSVVTCGGAFQCHLRRFCLAKTQGQGDVPVKLVHGQITSRYRVRRSIRGIS
ncbi:hypothetical protein D3C79_707810 [compost metagenome]